MNYYISRGGQQYGPYSLADVQKYIAQGSVSPSDYARTENMNNWAPLSQLLASGAPPPPGPAAAAPPQWSAYQPQPPAFQPAQAAYAQPGYPAAPVLGMQTGGPVPPSLHWALVILLGWLTCGIFTLVWLFIETSFIKKIRPDSNLTMLYILAMVVPIVGFVPAAIAGLSHSEGGAVVAGLLMFASWIVAIVLQIMAHFKARRLLVEYYNTVEPIHLRLSGAMTFFFNILYFQHHFSRIAQWKRTGVLVPQG